MTPTLVTLLAVSVLTASGSTMSASQTLNSETWFASVIFSCQSVVGPDNQV